MERRRAQLIGLLATGAPATFVVWGAVRPPGDPGPLPGPWGLVAETVAAASLALAGLLLGLRPPLSRPVGILGLLAVPALCAGQLRERPGLALAMLTVVWLFAVLLWAVSAPRPPAGTAPVAEVDPRHADPRHAWEAARAALSLAIACWLAVAAARVSVGTVPTVGASLAIAAALAFSLHALWSSAGRLRRLALLWSLLTCGVAAALARSTSLSLTSALAAPVGVFLIGRWGQRGGRRGEGILAAWWEAVSAEPARLFVVTFLLLGLLGGGLLALPDAASGPRAVPLLDALFTAFSAVCVTGLTVVDTATAFSGFGQGVILLLIQLGGLGIMTFATVAMYALGQRLGLRQEGAMAQLLGERSRANLYDAARTLVRVTLAAELGGAALLAVAFWASGDGAGTGLWRGLFTAISAFCNAGFALQTDSLIPYQQNPFVLHMVATLIIVGGLGPAVVIAVPDWIRRRRATTFSRLVIVTTAALLLVPFPLFLALEWSSSLGGLPVLDRLHNAWFQVVTPRTAGFNSVDLAALQAPTVLMTMALMFVGGSPGSTAGGIKVTTVALLLLAVAASLRGRTDAEAYGRRLSHESIYRAAAIATLGLLFVAVAVFAMELTQRMPALHATFEVVSAFGTVGLTLGGTAMLDDVGKVVIIVCMFAGRVGPLTLFLLLRSAPATRAWQRPEDDVPVG